MQVSEGRVISMEKEANGIAGQCAEGDRRDDSRGMTQWAELGSGVVSGLLSPQVFPVFIQGETY